MKLSATVAFLLALVGAASGAHAAKAAVEYKFDNGGSGTIIDEHFSFTYVSPDFINPPLMVMPQTCDAGTYNCLGVDFYPPNYVIDPYLIFPAYDVVGFKANGENFYYFSPNAFSTPGTYNDAFSGRDTLTVTEISAAPEPSLWALMIGSIGLTGLVLRRRKVTRHALATMAS